jgi:hypothetical protein
MSNVSVRSTRPNRAASRSAHRRGAHARRSSGASTSPPSPSAAPARAGSPCATPAHLPRAHRRHPLAHEINRSAVAVVIAQDLGHARSLDLRSLIEQLTNDRLQPIKHRSRRSALIARRLCCCDEPPDRPAVDPNRCAISRCETPSAAIALTCAHSIAQRTSRRLPELAVQTTSRLPTTPVNTGQPSGALFSSQTWRSIELPASPVGG